MAQENVEIVRLALETWERGDLTGWLKIEKFHKQGKKTPPWLKTDKPWDDPDVTGKPVSVTVQIPPLDSLVHVRRPLPGHQGGAAPWEAARRAAVLLLQPLKRGAPSREAFGEALEAIRYDGMGPWNPKRPAPKGEPSCVPCPPTVMCGHGV
jgi:hypothetical protein